MPQISVIVPVYKVEKYLKRCVDSILSQTFTDFELILVDDGSPDSCPQICDQYAQQDKRVHVLHQKNGGLSAARNAGIDWAFANSNSQWLTFVDSDDWIHPQTLEALLKAAQDNHVDVSICGFQKTNGEEVEVPSDLPVQLWSPEDFYVKYIVNAAVAWGKLYKKDCFSEICYPVGKLHEDEFVTYRILFQYEKIAFVNAPLYAYFQNPAGIMQSVWTRRRLDGLYARKQQIDYFAQYNFKQARLRAERALLWSAKEQLEIVTALGQDDDIRYLRRLLRRYLHRYKKDLSLMSSRATDLYEAVYPRGMKLYWLLQVACTKIGLNRGNRQ